MPHSSELRVDLSKYHDPLSKKSKIARLLWGVVWLFFFRLSPRRWFGWRRFLLSLFKARLKNTANIYPSVKVWAPWNLEMGHHSCLGPDVDCYCMALIRIGDHAVVSQYSYLCSGSHDIGDPAMRLMSSPILICDQAWVCADAFIGPGVTIGEGAVVGARASVFKDVEPWTVVGGNPAKFIKQRVMHDSK